MTKPEIIARILEIDSKLYTLKSKLHTQRNGSIEKYLTEANIKQLTKEREHLQKTYVVGRG